MQQVTYNAHPDNRRPGRHRAAVEARVSGSGGVVRQRLLPLGGGLLAAGLLISLATGAGSIQGGQYAAQPAGVPAAPSADLAQAATLSSTVSAKRVADAKAAQVAAANRAARAAEAARVAKVAAANRAARAQAAAQAKAARAEAARRGPAVVGASAPERGVGRTLSVSGPSGAKSLARDMVAARGWSSNEFRCLERLWEKESNWKHTATNRSSGAYGIPQSLPAHKMASAGSDWRTNPATQIKWGLNYIADRYDRPCNAWAHSQRVNWY